MVANKVSSITYDFYKAVVVLNPHQLSPQLNMILSLDI